MTAGTKPKFVIENLTREQDLSASDRTNSTLSDLATEARVDEPAGETYVALDGNRVAGYYALTTGSVHRHESPQRIAQGLANHPIGVVLLARLAVDRTQQGKAWVKRFCSMHCPA